MREVNENIAELGERFGLQEETLELMCRELASRGVTLLITSFKAH